MREVLVDDDDKQATVIVPDDQLSLAIGREGQNARLAARLTGWRVDIRSETEFAKQEQRRRLHEEEEARRPLPRDPRQRPPLPERRAAGLALLRPRRPPGARGQGHRRRRPGLQRPRRDAGAALRGVRRARPADGAAPLRYRGGSRSCPIPRRALPGRGAWLHRDTRLLRRRGRPPRLPARLQSARVHPTGHRRLHHHMAKKRVHELAKQYDMPSAEVLKRLNATASRSRRPRRPSTRTRPTAR